MRVLILSQYYPPEEVPLPSSLAQHLHDAGHHVRVLTGYPNYPAGNLFPGYRQRWRDRRLVDGIELLRVPLWIDHSLSPLKRMLNYASFGLSAATASTFARGADVVYVYATQMTPAFAPWMWRFFGRAPYVLHVQDLWPDSITGSSLVSRGFGARIVDRLLTPWLNSLYKRSNAVIGIAPTMVETLRKRGVDPQKLHLQYNWATEDFPMDDLIAGTRGSDSGVSLLYAGNIGDMQDLETMVHAAHRTADAGIRLTLVGDGVALPRLKQLVAELASTNITFMGRVPRSEMGPVYAHSDFSMVTLKDLPNFRGTIPSKLQASLAQGLPIITTVQGDVRDIVDGFQVGFSANAESIESLEAAFRRAAAATPEQLNFLANRARRVYVDRFSRSAGVAAIEGILITAGAERSNQRADRKEPTEFPARPNTSKECRLGP